MRTKSPTKSKAKSGQPRAEKAARPKPRSEAQGGRAKATRENATARSPAATPASKRKAPRAAASKAKKTSPRVAKESPSQAPAGAVPASALADRFEPIELPLTPPCEPMEATSLPELPQGEGWQFEPKWDGFRCLAFKHGEHVELQSKSGQSLGRYFPELVESMRRLPFPALVLDGEIIIVIHGRLAFDELLARIHPAESRVRRLAAETPAAFAAFDLLVNRSGRSLSARSLAERRRALEAHLSSVPQGSLIRLSPASGERAQGDRWMSELAALGFDGVVAKRLDAPYLFGERSAMVKVKRARTADCVVGGFRYASSGGEIGSLLLGLYNEEGKLDHVGFAASFTERERKELKPIVEQLIGPPGFTGRAPGGPSRWSRDRPTEWTPLRPELVCEVRYDHFSGGRFRHGTKLLRFRPDKTPEKCTTAQLRPVASAAALESMGLA